MRYLGKLTGFILLIVLTGSLQLHSASAGSSGLIHAYPWHFNTGKRFVNVHFDGTTRHLRISSIYWNVIVEIYAIDGTLVHLYQMKEKRADEFDLSYLKNGIYLIKFISDEKVQMEKVILSD